MVVGTAAVRLRSPASHASMWLLGAGRRMVGSDVLPFSPRISYFCPNRKCSLAWGPCFRDAVSVAGLLLTFFAQFLFFIFGAKWRPDSTLGTK